MLRLIPTSPHISTHLMVGVPASLSSAARSALLTSLSQPSATTERALPNGGGYEISVGSNPRYFVSPLVAAAAASEEAVRAAAEAAKAEPHLPISPHISPCDMELCRSRGGRHLTTSPPVSPSL